MKSYGRDLGRLKVRLRQEGYPVSAKSFKNANRTASSFLERAAAPRSASSPCEASPD